MVLWVPPQHQCDRVLHTNAAPLFMSAILQCVSWMGRALRSTTECLIRRNGTQLSIQLANTPGKARMTKELSSELAVEDSGLLFQSYSASLPLPPPPPRLLHTECITRCVSALRQ